MTTVIKEEVEEYIPLRDVVFKSLRESIITGKRKPGDRLMEIKLSEQMGVSRTPIREAIKKLQLEGLVIIHPRRGAVVAPINEKDLKEILEIRKALESLACRLACKKATEEDVKKLRDINRIMKHAVEMEDIELITEQDVAFHELITELAQNTHLTSMLDQIKEHLYRYRLEFIREINDRNILVDEHSQIIDAIAMRDTSNGSRAVSKHIGRQENFILSSLAK